MNANDPSFAPQPRAPSVDFAVGTEVVARRVHWGENGERVEAWIKGRVLSAAGIPRRFHVELDYKAFATKPVISFLGRELRLPAAAP